MSQILGRVGVNIKQVHFVVWANSERSYWLNRVHMTINKSFLSGQCCKICDLREETCNVTHEF